MAPSLSSFFFLLRKCIIYVTTVLYLCVERKNTSRQRVKGAMIFATPICRVFLGFDTVHDYFLMHDNQD